MIKKYFDFSKQPVTLILSGCITLGIFIYFILLDKRIAPAGAPGVINLQLSFSVTAFQEILDAWGAAGIQMYIAHMWLDFIFPIAYAIFISGLIALLLKHTELSDHEHVNTVMLTAPAAALLDFLENSLHLILLADPNHLSKILIYISGLAAFIKWTLLGIAVLVIFSSATTFFSKRFSE